MNYSYNYPNDYVSSNYNSNHNSLDMKTGSGERLIGAGFVFPFLLGGVTGAAIAPAFWRPPYGRPYGPYYGPYYSSSTYYRPF